MTRVGWNFEWITRKVPALEEENFGFDFTSSLIAEIEKQILRIFWKLQSRESIKVVKSGSEFERFEFSIWKSD